jgi:glycosyltransferase involved in cell wall biosynthesis
MRTSIVIAAHNEGPALAKTIRSCVETCGPLDYEIVVADDASTDGSVELAAARFPQLRVTRHDRRRGASATKHLGACEASGEVLVFLDGHCKPEEGAVRRLVEDVELLDGEAIVTPATAALDVGRWRNDPRQVGHGYRLGLKTFDCGWLPLARMRAVQEGRRQFHESPALIGCALAISRTLYHRLRGFDADMLTWGVEDLDLGLKCWLMGGRILHDAQARIGHRFRRQFDNYPVPAEHVVVNQLRTARKHFTHSVWADWLDRCRQRYPGRLAEHPEGLWARVWQLFEENRSSVERERSYVQATRVRDEFWYAQRFGLDWPSLAAGGTPKPTKMRAFAEGEPADGPNEEPSPSPPPPPTVIFEPDPVKTGFTRGKRPNGTDRPVLSKTVTATITPPGCTDDVTFEMRGVDDDLATLGDVNRACGSAWFECYGKGQSTNTSVTKIAAVYDGNVIAEVEVKVVVPDDISHSNADIAAKPPEIVENKVGSSETSPVWYIPGDTLGENERGLATIWMHLMDVQLDDQFGDKLDEVYDGVSVDERLGTGPWFDINQDISGGSYDDPVGAFWLRGQTVLNQLPANRGLYILTLPSTVVDNWPNAAKPPMPLSSFTPNISARVGGHGVGTVRRKATTSRNSQGQDLLEIEWLH